MSSPYETNPYEPPREPTARVTPNFTDHDSTRMAELQQRVANLERRLSRSWFVHPNFVLRLLAVWGNWVLGYLLLAAAIGSVMVLVTALSNF